MIGDCDWTNHEHFWLENFDSNHILESDLNVWFKSEKMICTEVCTFVYKKSMPYIALFDINWLFQGL